MVGIRDLCIKDQHCAPTTLDAPRYLRFDVGLMTRKNDSRLLDCVIDASAIVTLPTLSIICSRPGRGTDGFNQRTG
jgi:hypothetical protein